MILNKINGRIIKSISGFVFILNLLFFPSTVQAQTVSLAVWPPILDVMIQPGKSITQVFKLINNGDNTAITAKIVPFEPLGNLGQIKLITAPSPAAEYFSLQNADLELPATFTLKAGATQEFVLKIKVPETAPETDHYFTFLFESNNSGVITGTGAKTLGSIGANILLTVSKTGQPIRVAQITKFQISPCLFFNNPICLIDSFSPPQFNLILTNPGRTKFKAIGQLEIFNTFNRKVATLPFREDNVLANSSRQLILTSDWQPVFPLGRYQTTASITPENSVNSISQTVAFYYFPYKALLALSLIYLLFRLTYNQIKY